MEGILELAQELAEIGRLVDDDDVSTTLSRFVRRMVQTVPDCDEAALTVLADGQPEIVARHHKTADPGSEPARSALDAELTTKSGPVYDTLTYAEPRRIADLAVDYRWPQFAAAGINAGYRSCVFLPLPAGDDVATFSLFSAKPSAFGGTSYDIALLFALHAGVAFDNVKLYDDSTKLLAHLRTALGTRTVIGQAQGILMHRYGLTADTAFTVLKRGSQDGNLKLRALALELVEAQTSGSLSQTLAKRGLTSG
ncbi:GAF and ANTAR domain-containing protein [Kribbella sp. NBC_00709]|uniref:GAF and ANTAR domain-containing protein n=1 Tax=Kribbella sp. NBC_00709 TaxID=2975972 RepID=UPI002E27BDE7|nr:GAF and ANTAR domain-containing protein [Kribbella sp. NBC_00709]